MNFSAVWLRPWFYLFSNAAITDQLFGGLTFVTGGSWFQTPPAYFSIAKNGLYIGTSQTDETTNRYARRSGPIFPVGAGTDLKNFPPCTRGLKTTCNIDLDGTALLAGRRLQSQTPDQHLRRPALRRRQPVPQRRCLEVPRPAVPGQAARPVHSARRRRVRHLRLDETTDGQMNGGDPDPNQMLVIDAAVGWKQPNGFYYPPAFAYRHSTFFKKIPPALQSLNNCVDSAGVLSPGSCRHNVVDRTLKYINGNMQVLDGAASIFPNAQGVGLAVGPIDFQTFLADLDASLTGASGVIPVGPPSAPAARAAPRWRATRAPAAGATPTNPAAAR